MPKETLRFEPFAKSHGNRRDADDVEIESAMFGDRGIITVRIRGNRTASLVMSDYDAKRLGVMLFGIAEELSKQKLPAPPNIKAGDLVKVLSLNYHGELVMMNGSYEGGTYKVSSSKAKDPNQVRLIQHVGYRSHTHDRSLVVFHSRPAKKE